MISMTHTSPLLGVQADESQVLPQLLQEVVKIQFHTTAIKDKNTNNYNNNNNNITLHIYYTNKNISFKLI